MRLVERIEVRGGIDQRERQRAAEQGQVRTLRRQLVGQRPQLVGDIADAVVVEIVAGVVVEVVAAPVDGGGVAAAIDADLGLVVREVVVADDDVWALEWNTTAVS